MEIGECNVCFSNFTKLRKVVICPACPGGKESYPCTACTQTYLLNSPLSAHCMSCKHEWGYNFLAQTFPKTWITGLYRKSRQQKALEREKGLLQQTLPLVEVERGKEKIRKQILELRTVRDELVLRMRDIDQEIRVHENTIMHGVVQEPKETAYTFPCTVETEKGQCKGFIEAKTWKCGLCEAKICKSCHISLAEKTPGKKHKCKESDVETAKTIMKETKPCPKCKARIFKIEGCSQMFCTATGCHTPFDWVTGQIVTGVIHNPHYYELMRKMGTVQRTPGDVICGGLPHILALQEHIKSLPNEMAEEVTSIHRQAGEISDYIAGRRPYHTRHLDFTGVRLDYLMGRIPSEEYFKREIFMRERRNEKQGEELQILETFQNAVVEALNEFRLACTDIDGLQGKRIQEKVKLKVAKAKRMISNVAKITQFCNKAFEDNYKAMGYKSFPSIVLNMRYPYTKPRPRRHLFDDFSDEID